LYDRVRGIDGALVEGHGEQKSMSREETFSADISDDAVLERELFALVARVASDLRSGLLSARTIRVKIKDADFTIRQAGRTLTEAVVSDRVIYGVARELLHTLRSRRRTAARLIGNRALVAGDESGAAAARAVRRPARHRSRRSATAPSRARSTACGESSARTPSEPRS